MTGIGNPGSRDHRSEGQPLELNLTRKPRPRNGTIDPDQTLDNARTPLAPHRRTRRSLSGIPWTQRSGAVAEGGGRRRRDRLLLRGPELGLSPVSMPPELSSFVPK